MKIIYTIIIYIASCTFAYSQGEIIERKSRSGKSFNLEIVEVKNDSIVYKYLGRIRKIPLSSVIAYRVDCNKDAFTFPNPKDRGRYEIKNNTAFNKKINDADADEYKYSIDLLKIYKLDIDTLQPYRLPNKIVFLRKNSSRKVMFKPERSIYIILKNDSIQMKIAAKIFKIANDSFLYLDHKADYYAINKKDIKYVGFESPRSCNTRIFIGSLCSRVLLPAIFISLAMTSPIWWIIQPVSKLIPLYFFTHPKIKEYDVENKWQLTLR